MHIFKVNLTPEDYWLLRQNLKSAEDVQAMLQAIIDKEIEAIRKGTAA